MAGFHFKLEHADGTPADRPTLHTVVPTGRPATRSRSERTKFSAWSRRGSMILTIRC